MGIWAWLNLRTIGWAWLGDLLKEIILEITRHLCKFLFTHNPQRNLYE